MGENAGTLWGWLLKGLPSQGNPPFLPRGLVGTGPTPMRCSWNANLPVDPLLGVWGTQGVTLLGGVSTPHRVFDGETRNNLKWTIIQFGVGELVAKCVVIFFSWYLLSWWSAKTQKCNKSVWPTLVRVTKCKILFPSHWHHGNWIRIPKFSNLYPLGDSFNYFVFFKPYLEKFWNLTKIFFRWGVQPPTSPDWLATCLLECLLVSWSRIQPAISCGRFPQRAQQLPRLCMVR